MNENNEPWWYEGTIKSAMENIFKSRIRSTEDFNVFDSVDKLIDDDFKKVESVLGDLEWRISHLYCDKCDGIVTYDGDHEQKIASFNKWLKEKHGYNIQVNGSELLDPKEKTGSFDLPPKRGYFKRELIKEGITPLTIEETENHEINEEDAKEVFARLKKLRDELPRRKEDCFNAVCINKQGNKWIGWSSQIFLANGQERKEIDEIISSNDKQCVVF